MWKHYVNTKEYVNSFTLGPSYWDHMMSHDASHDLCVPQTNLHKMKPKLANAWRDVTNKAEEAVK